MATVRSRNIVESVLYKVNRKIQSWTKEYSTEEPKVLFQMEVSSCESVSLILAEWSDNPPQLSLMRE